MCIIDEKDSVAKGKILKKVEFFRFLVKKREKYGSEQKLRL